MATKKKMLQAAAGQAGGAALNVEDVFSTYLYDGTGAAQTITNGIDLDGEGGAILTKRRDSTSGSGPWFNDTERGINKYISTSSTGAETDSAGSISAVTSSGYTLGTFGGWNNSAGDYASWTFRKAPKFFDVVTWTSTGSSSQRVNHSLGATPGLVAIKRTDAAGPWMISPLYSDGDRGYGSPNEASKFGFNTSSPILTKVNLSSGFTDTDFRPNYVEGYSTYSCISGATYVAYLFAHNDGDGEFGPDGDQDIIKCGSYTGNDGTQDIDLGFEPAWVLVKSSSNARDWKIIDNMRGFAAAPNNKWLTPNSSNAEENINASASTIEPTATGFRLTTGDAETNASGWSYIYIAIRRGTKVPESATEVFALQQDDAGDGNAPAFRSDFPVDAAFSKNAAAVSVNFFGSRLQGANYLRTSETNAEAANADFQWDYMNGWNSEPAQGSSVISYMWKRAPGYFDVVAYTGTGGTTSQKAHNLGVVPEMIWVKTRSLTGREWVVWVDGFGTGQTNGTGTKEWLYLNTTASLQSTTLTGNTPWGGPHTATTFSTGSWSRVNDTGETYIAYLFASLPGISKVGSYTGTGATLNIDCGFSSGARFVLIKKSSASGSWYVFDTERGIVAGNDPYLYLNLTNAEVSSRDGVDPLSSGFALTSDATFNASGDTYIFYAIA